MKNIVLCLFISLLPILCLGQNAFPNTIEMDSTMTSPTASLDDIAWLTGHWEGASFGGVTEEIWSPPLGPSMMGSFKLVVNDEVQFYELMTLTEENGSLMLRILHFDKELNGWEEQGHPEEFPLVKITDQALYFDGLTFERTSKKKINIYVIVDSKENGKQEMKFPYAKKSKLKSH